MEEDVYKKFEKEQKIIDLFGYNLVKTDNPDYLTIVDDNNKQVGHIEVQRGKETDNVYYFTIIDSDDFVYNSIRESDKINFHYQFDIKRKKGEKDYVILDISENPSLLLFSGKYGTMTFKIEDGRLYLDYGSKTQKSNVHEFLDFQNVSNLGDNRPKEYSYKISYCDKKIDMFESYTRKGVTTRQISGIEKQDEDNCLELTEMVIKAGKIKKNKKTVVPGTVEEMAAKHQMGIDSINYFRSLINQIIPTKKDIIAEMLSEDLIKDKGLTVLFPSLIKTENYHKGLK